MRIPALIPLEHSGTSFSLDVKVVTEGGKALVDKSYKAGEKIDLKSTESAAEGPEDVADDSPKKLDETKASK